MATRSELKIRIYGLDMQKVAWRARYNHEIGKATAEVLRRIEADIFAQYSSPETGPNVDPGV